MSGRSASIPRLALLALGTLCWSATAQAPAPHPVELSAVQRLAIEAEFSRADANSDGKLSRDESGRVPELTTRFEVLDKDRDGFLSLEEFAIGAPVPIG